MDLRPLVAVAGVLAGIWLATVVVLWLNRPSRDVAFAAATLLRDLAVLGKRIAADGDTPRSAKAALVFLGVWLASPIDLIPEFIPVLGPLDDIVVAAVVLRWVARRVGTPKLRALWPGSDASFSLVERLIGSRRSNRSPALRG